MDSTAPRNELYRQLLNSGYSTATGGVIYSGDETLKKGKYLFYGLNPGGDGGHSIEQDFKKKHLDLIDSSYNHTVSRIIAPSDRSKRHYHYASWCIQLSGWKVEKSRRCDLQEGGTWQLELPRNNRTASRQESFADKPATLQPVRYRLSPRNH